MPIIRVIDYETTGTPDDADAEIVEMAKVDIDMTSRVITSSWSSLCKPRGPIPAATKAVHHITEVDVSDAPQARELWSEMIDDLTSEDILVAHNAKFEQHFTPPCPAQWIDTYKIARIIWPEAPGHSNQVLRYWRNLPLDARLAVPAHRALPDAYVTAWLLLSMLGHESGRPDAIAWMIQASKFPALLHIMNFGKHKGMKFEDAPADYLQWIADKSDMNEDTKFTARYWLSKR